MIRMTLYSLSKLHRRERYKLIAGAIVPRPIALVTTLNEDGNRMGEVKNTTRNILRTAQFVVNLLDEDLLADTVGCATDFPSSISETTAMGLELVPSIEIATPRIQRSP